jgi:hypothetical protein
MNKTIALLGIVISALQLTGCSVISAVATSTRMEDARTTNAGKQLVPKDGGTYLIAVGMETASYLGSGSTDWKINDTTFSQPRGTYSVVRVRPGTYAAYGNKRVAGGGEAASSIEIKEGETVCFYLVNPLSAPARMETYKGDACDPILRPLQNQNVIGEVK